MRELERSLTLYRGAAGPDEVGRLFGGRTHRELLLIAAGDARGPLRGRRIGLYHVAWRLGAALDDLREAKKRLDALGITVAVAVDHHVSASLYLNDPDGNDVELFVDRPDYPWRERSDWLEMPPGPLAL